MDCKERKYMDCKERKYMDCKERKYIWIVRKGSIYGL